MNNLPYCLTNMDVNTSIRFAAIQGNHISSEVCNDFWTSGEDLTYKAWLQDVSKCAAGLYEQFLEEFPKGVTEHNHLDIAEFIGEQISRSGELWKLTTDVIEKRPGHICCMDLVDSLAEMQGMEFKDSTAAGEYLFESSGYMDYMNDRAEFDSRTVLFKDCDLKVLCESEGDLVIEWSRYATLRGHASPCFPNGCHLETDGNLWCYCLPFYCFDEYSPAPYNWLVNLETGELVWRSEGDYCKEDAIKEIPFDRLNNLIELWQSNQNEEDE